MIKELEAISTEEFGIKCFGISTPEGVRKRLLDTDQCKSLTKEISNGNVTENDLREWVKDLLEKHFKPGIYFDYQISLAALSVCLENSKSAFADEYLIDLADLNLVEVTMSSLVARVCLQHRKESQLNKNKGI